MSQELLEYSSFLLVAKTIRSYTYIYIYSIQLQLVFVPRMLCCVVCTCTCVVYIYSCNYSLTCVRWTNDHSYYDSAYVIIQLAMHLSSCIAIIFRPKLLCNIVRKDERSLKVPWSCDCASTHYKLLFPVALTYHFTLSNTVYNFMIT